MAASQVQSPSSKKLGLDDPNRVHKILDRGLGFLPPPPAQPTCPVSVNMTSNGDLEKCDFKSIASELDKALLPCGLNPERMFLPHDELYNILPFSKVYMLLQQLSWFSNVSDKTELARAIYYGSDGQPSRLKLFAALIGAELVEEMKTYMHEGLNDHCFPLRTNYGDRDRYIYCDKHGDKHCSVNALSRPDYRDDLKRWSYRLTTPFIKQRPEIHSHYVLNGGDILPIISVHGTPVFGGFSEVQKVQLHPSSCDFQRNGVRYMPFRYDKPPVC